MTTNKLMTAVNTVIFIALSSFLRYLLTYIARGMEISIAITLMKQTNTSKKRIIVKLSIDYPV
jgi:hypothetical protein